MCIVKHGKGSSLLTYVFFHVYVLESLDRHNLQYVFLKIQDTILIGVLSYHFLVIHVFHDLIIIAQMISPEPRQLHLRAKKRG